MGFIVGILFGFLVGVAIVAGLDFAMQFRSRKRILKAAGVQRLGWIQLEELRKLCGTSYPSWISFPTFEKVKWLNKNLEKIWPSVTAGAEELIRETVEPMLEAYRPMGINSLKFEKLTLGTVAPKIDGISVQSLRKSQVIMDLEFLWGGNPSIILGVQPVVGPALPVQLKDLSFFATVRVMFQLSEEIPCISAVVVALLAKPVPQIKYTLKVIGGSMGAIPGLSQMIDDLVQSLVVDQMQWPHRIVVPIGNVPPDVMSNLELMLQGCLTVTVVRATNLKNKEMVGKSDPYVVLYVRVLFKERTRTIDDNLNPEFNEFFKLNVEDQETQSLVLHVVKDQDIGEDKSLGIVAVPLVAMKPDELTEMTLKLCSSLDTDRVKNKGNRGTLIIKVKYHPFTKEEQVAAMEAEKKIIDAKEKAKAAGLIGGTMDAVGGGLKLVSGGVGAVGSGVGMVGTGLGKAGKMMTRGVTRHFSSNKLNASPMHENGSSK